MADASRTPSGQITIYDAFEKKDKTVERIKLDEKEWQKRLGEDTFCILRQKGTEQPFTGSLLANKAKGVYQCAACGTDLFTSGEKFESGSGWPSFFQPVDPRNVGTSTDTSHGMRRVEVHCARCNGHLGHVFTDGPEPTGKRYCINSKALKFKSF